MSRIANILSIAGTDPTGGAGIQADLKTFGALGAYGMAVVTAVVSQNTQGVRAFVAMEPAFVADQIDAVFEDVRVDAVKIGMVANGQLAEAISARLRHHRARNIVFDPVLVSTSRHALSHEGDTAAIRDSLAPLAEIMTPNLSEAAALLDEDMPETIEAMRAAAERLLAFGSRHALVKGGHLGGAESRDILHGPDGRLEFSVPRIETTSDHGTGCTLSSAIAALLPSRSMAEAVREAKDYLTGALAAAHDLEVGRGHGPVHHFYRR